MDEKLIEQVLQIEKQAQEIHEAAKRDAEQLPLQAEKDAQVILDKARAEAQEEARRIVASAQAKDESARILAEAEERVRATKGLSMSHFERAVGYVLDRVAGRE